MNGFPNWLGFAENLSSILKSNVVVTPDGLFLGLLNNNLPKVSSNWEMSPTTLPLTFQSDWIDDYGYSTSINLTTFPDYDQAILLISMETLAS
jgi:hypothetical protein